MFVASCERGFLLGSAARMRTEIGIGEIGIWEIVIREIRLWIHGRGSRSNFAKSCCIFEDASSITLRNV